MLAIISNLIDDCVEVHMDDFTVYGDGFDQALENLENVLIYFQESQLALSSVNCEMMKTKRIVLGHHVSAEWIK